MESGALALTAMQRPVHIVEQVVVLGVPQHVLVNVQLSFRVRILVQMIE
jgi:hypothetical protein